MFLPGFVSTCLFLHGLAPAAPTIAHDLATQSGAATPQQEVTATPVREDSRLSAEYDALAKEFKDAERAYSAPYRQAKSEAELEKINLDARLNPSRVYLPKFRDLATRARGTDAGLQSLLWIVEHAMSSRSSGNDASHPDSAAEQAAIELSTDYIASEKLVRLAASLRYAELMGERTPSSVLSVLEKTSPHPNVRAQASFSLACMMLDATKGVSDPSAEEPAKRKLADVRRDYPNSPAAKQTERLLFELEHLQTGMIAPDFEATDVDGVRFKLSDYRGKVVVLDFCRSSLLTNSAMITHEKTLVDRLPSKAFALIGINSDGDRESVKKFVAQTGVTWRQAVDGSASESIATRWSVTMWPTTYVLDANGMIRFKNVRGEGLDHAVDTLLAEMKQ